MKKAIRYLRFSSDGQSHSSIEKQEMYTTQWLDRNNVELVDTFIDAGHSAKTFDRPDFIKLQKFIKQYHTSVDYLVVDEMDRFSRDAGEAITLAKNMQLQYNIQIVSASENLTFDYHTSGSFFRAGLSLLLAEENNINRMNKINGGIYTAKAKEGRYVYGKPPFGYVKTGTGKSRHLEIDEAKAIIVRFIFEACLLNKPEYLILEEAYQMGLTAKGNSVIRKILTNPVYAGKQLVKPFKDMPGGIFPALHKPIIDELTWQRVQAKLVRPKQEKQIVSEQLPLRGLLKCHCGQLLTGAPSRGRHGGLFYYYKCLHTRHNNISAKKAHIQLDTILELMSLPTQTINEIRERSEQKMEERNRNNKVLLTEKRQELAREQNKLKSVEEKWIMNQVTFETYDRWVKEINRNLVFIKSQIEALSKDQNSLYRELYAGLEKLSDLKYVYHNASVTAKHELLRQGFDWNLYYSEGIYRTPTMNPALAHNALEMKEKGVLILENKRENLSILPSSGVEGSRTPVQTS